MAQGPSIEDIVLVNWSLDEYITNFLRQADIIEGISLSSDDQGILRKWAREIDPKVERLYNRLGWPAFRQDLLYIHDNPGRLFFTGGKYGLWFRSGNEFIVITGERDINIIDATTFEDVFLNLISLQGQELTIVEAQPLPEDITAALDVLYEERKEEVESVSNQMLGGRVIRVSGFPIELTISPLVEMVDGYMLINSEYEFVLLGKALAKANKKFRREVTADVYTYEDGQRLISTLLYNQQYKWQIINL